MNPGALLKALALVAAWPLLAWMLSHYHPALLTSFGASMETALLGLALSGILVAIGFSQWRIGCAFLLLLCGYAILRQDHYPDALLMPVLFGLALLPWLPERGLLGPGPMVSAALLLVSSMVWLRGGEPAAIAEAAMLRTVPIPGVEIAWAALPAVLSLALLLPWLLWRRDGLLVGFAGALLTALSLVPPLSLTQPLSAAIAAALALWTGLLLHAWRIAYLDQLTGLPNRRALEEQLKRLPGRWSLAMLDVDHFKKFNDTWGHDIGDQVLRRVAGTLAGVGGRGRAFRYGGEEFSVIFPHDDMARAQQAIEDIRARIEETPFEVRGERKGSKSRGKGKGRASQTITISAGLTCAQKESAQTTFKRADKALYRAKAQGRNRVVKV